MGFLADAQTLLKADPELVALATGGIVTSEDVGRLGINRTSVPGAFDGHGRIKPTVFLKLGDVIPDYEAADDGLRAVSARVRLECWLYQDSGYLAIDAMAARVYAVLHANDDIPTAFGGRYILHSAGDSRPPIRDTDLDASVQRCDYRARFIRRVAA